MIRYALRCACGHDFDAWFNSAAAYDAQAEGGLIDCPGCGGHAIDKAPMAPAVSRSRAAPVDPARMRAAMMALARQAKREAEDVGQRFVDEARKIHVGESAARPIWGQATLDDARALRDEGIAVLPLPDVPDHDA